MRLLEVERSRGVENFRKLKDEAECGEMEVGRAEEPFILYSCFGHRWKCLRKRNVRMRRD